MGLIPPFGWPRGRELEAAAASRLLLASTADLPDNRRSILVRQTDADINRGAIAALVESNPEAFVWSAFAWETYRYSEIGERLDFDLEPYAHVGPFAFPCREYEELFQPFPAGAPTVDVRYGHYFRFAQLPGWSKCAADRGNYKQAALFARELLELAKDHVDNGNAIHHGHLVLGRVALAAGDIESARRELILGARTPGSPQLNSFGPNMKLAKDLLAAGETGAVREYLELCRVFWKMGAQRLDKWIDDVAAGRIPEFGANLAY